MAQYWEPAAGPPEYGHPVKAKARVNLTKVLLVAAAVQALTLAGNSVITLATKQPNNLVRWLAPTAVTLLIAVVQAVIEALGKDDADTAASWPPPSGRGPGYRPADGYPPHGLPRVQRRTGTPLLAAIFVVLLVVGVGGFAVSSGVRYGAGYFSGKEAGPDYLVRPQTATVGKVRLTVNHVYYTRHFTRVEVTARNTGASSIELPLFGYCVFAGKDGTTLNVEPSKSQWSQSVPPGVLSSGTVTFSGKLPAADKVASFSFTTIFGTFDSRAITVKRLALREPAKAST